VANKRTKLANKMLKWQISAPKQQINAPTPMIGLPFALKYPFLYFIQTLKLRNFGFLCSFSTKYGRYHDLANKT
jgi:hypothetical protein